METKKGKLEDELVLYVVVNKDVPMTAAKMAVQVGHACTYAVSEAVYNIYEPLPSNNPDYPNDSSDESCHDPDRPERQVFERWFQRGKHQKKVILSASQKTLEELIKYGWTAVRDNGHNEVAPNTLTCVTPGIVWKNWMAPIVKKHRMQVLKHKDPSTSTS